MPFPALELLVERLRAFRSPTPQGDIALAAVATILRDGEDGPEVLFIERAHREGDPWSGDIAFPGGKREKADDSLLAAAVRETMEEIGLVLPATSFVVRLDDVFGRTNGYRVAQFVFVVSETAELTANPEVASFFWTPLSMLIQPERVETISLERMGFKFDVPCIRLGAHVLWGMTYRMTHALAEAMGLKANEDPPR